MTDQGVVTRLQEVCTTHGESWEGKYLLGLVDLERCDAEAAVKVLQEAQQ